MDKDMNRDPIDSDPAETERAMDEWLESALRQSGKSQPRAGLERRVLAGLQAERYRIASRRRRWWWVAAMAAATGAIALAVWPGPIDRTRTREAVVTVAGDDIGSRERPVAPLELRRAPGTPGGALARNARRRRPTRPTTRTPEAGDVARLERFPAPWPLSDQEKLLLRYVQQFPQQAALIARAQTDLQAREQREMAAPWPKDADQEALEQQQ